jgi:GH141 insertion domain
VRVLPSRTLRRLSASVAVSTGALVLAGPPAVAATRASERPANSGATIVFVSPHAGARGDGTKTSPYGSLDAARAGIRHLLPGMRHDIVVMLEDGTYPVERTVRFGTADSGRNGNTVVYEAAPGAHPVISGGRIVTGWTLNDATRNIWVATVPASLRTRQLYVDGRRAPVAQGAAPVTLARTAEGYQAASPVMASWTNPRGIEFVYPSGPSNWTESRCRVAAIAGTTITMQQPCWDNTTLRPTPGTVVNASGFGQPLGAQFHIENAYELLTQPGQWYLDDTVHRLYYLPLPGQDIQHATVVAPALETLMAGAGTPNAPVHDLAFRGITFSHAGWTAPSSRDGYSDFQTGKFLTGTDAWKLQGACDAPGATCPYTNYPQVPGNVTFTNDLRITFTDDTFTHLGATGLALGDGSRQAVVQGSEFSDTSCSGLSIGGVDRPNARGARATAHVTVVNSYVHAVAAEYQSCAALSVGYAQRTRIVHNQIDDVPYSGIAIGWGGWQERLPGKGPLPNTSHDNVIAGNLIFDVMKVLVDGGGIYTNGIQGTSLTDGERIEHNVVLEQHHPSWAIYTDNGTEYANVTGNVVFDALFVPLAPVALPGTAPEFSFGGCGGGPIAYSGNFSIQADPAAGLIAAHPQCGGHPLDQVSVSDNHVITSLGEVPAGILAAAGLQPTDRTRLHPAPMPVGLPASTQYP